MMRYVRNIFYCIISWYTKSHHLVALDLFSIFDSTVIRLFIDDLNGRRMIHSMYTFLSYSYAWTYILPTNTYVYACLYMTLFSSAPTKLKNSFLLHIHIVHKIKCPIEEKPFDQNKNMLFSHTRSTLPFVSIHSSVI